jgi:hypothetical protein
VDRLQRRFRVTHPFHPCSGETFALVGYRRSWGHESVDGLDSEGRLFTVPMAWTDAGEKDLFRVLSGGRSYGRVRELLRLAHLLEGLER